MNITKETINEAISISIEEAKTEIDGGVRLSPFTDPEVQMIRHLLQRTLEKLFT